MTSDRRTTPRGDRITGRSNLAMEQHLGVTLVALAEARIAVPRGGKRKLLGDHEVGADRPAVIMSRSWWAHCFASACPVPIFLPLPEVASRIGRMGQKRSSIWRLVP